MTQTCSKCKLNQPLTAYHKDRSKKLGVRTTCKSCASKANKQWFKDNKIKREDYKERNASYIYERDKIYREKNSKKIEQYRKDNKAKLNSLKAKRRTQKKSNTPEISQLEKQLIEALYFVAQVISKSTGEQYHVDHIQPISKGGPHTFDNLQVIPAVDNLRKGSKYSTV